MHALLLADDDTELCDMLGQYLKAEDFAVTAVHDGEAALAEARSGRYELAVLDIMMPRMSGLDVLTASSGSNSAPTITCRNRPARACWWRASARSCGAPPRAPRPRPLRPRTSRSAISKSTPARAASSSPAARWR
jgi:response regulator RpfG family c-di-GMP phosphodiesterase